MADSTTHIEILPDHSMAAMVAVGNKTKSGEITFTPSDGDIEIIENSAELRNVCDPLLRAFAEKNRKSHGSETRVTMVHVKGDKSVIIPVEDGWEVDMIPVRETGGNPSVNGKELGLGHYAHLTEKYQVRGDMYAVLLLWKG